MSDIFTVGRGAYPHIKDPHVYIRKNRGPYGVNTAVLSFNRWYQLLEPYSAVDYVIDGDRLYFEFNNTGRTLEFSYYIARVKVTNDKRLFDFVSDVYYIPKFDKEIGCWYIEKHIE